MTSSESSPPLNRLPLGDVPNGTGAHGSGNGKSPSLVPGLNLTSPTSATAPRAGASELTVADIVTLVRTASAIVRARWHWGLLAALVVGSGLGYLVWRTPTEHRAQTTLLAQSALDQILGAAGERTGNMQEQENSLRNHLSVMQSRRFTVAMAADFSDEEAITIETPYLAPGGVPSRAGLEALIADRLAVERERGREFFTMSFSHRDPDVAVLVVDHASATYLKLVQQEFKQANVAAASLLQKQAEQLQDEISVLENQRRDYRKQNNIISVEENSGVLQERIRRLDSSLSDIRIQRVRLEKQVETAEASMARSTTPFDNALLANFGNNQTLRQELDRLGAQREVLASRYGPNHPKMRDIDSSIRGVEENILKGFDLAFRDLKSQYDAARTIEQQLQKEFDEAFNESIEVEKLANRYLILGNEVAAKRETLAELLKRVSHSGLLSQLPADVMRVVDPGYIDDPRVPRKALFGGIVFAFCGGIFLAVPLGLHVFDARLKGATDVEKVLGKELLGGIPRLHRVRPEDRPHVVRDNVEPANVEAFMALVAQLELSASNKSPGKTVLVTSTIPGEGKSTIASNLATAFTRAGKRTLLVDFDFRRPVQQQFHRAPTDRGFLAWARAGLPPGEMTDRSPLLGIHELSDGTHLLPAGGEDTQPTQFLVSKATTTLFAELRQRFDVIIIDTPPAGFFQDALVLARLADDTLLVAREARAPIAQIRRTIADIDKTHAPVLGVVLNGFSSHHLNPRLAYGYSYGNYGYGTTGGKGRRPRREPMPVAS